MVFHFMILPLQLFRVESAQSSIIRSRSGGSSLVVEVKSADDLEAKLLQYGNRVACVICPFGLSDKLLQSLQAEANSHDTSALNVYDPNVEGRWEAFMSADHVVRIVQRRISKIPLEKQCPFIVYAMPKRDKVADCWRQECAMRSGAFGFATKTDKLFELIKSVTDVLLPLQQNVQTLP
jgi:hypothetical protein